MNCIDCGADFERPVGRGRPRVRCVQCSPDQRRPPGAYVGLNVTSIPRSVVCPHCHESFIATFALQRYCGDACRNAKNNRRTQELARDRSPRSCGHCGSVFEPAYGELRNVYCTDACAAKHHALATSGNTHRRRARRFGGKYEPVNRLEIFERDGWSCRICGIPTPRELLGARAHNAPELDHLVPLARGGDHSPENTQCACRDCNLFKGDRTETEVAELLAA